MFFVDTALMIQFFVDSNEVNCPACRSRTRCTRKSSNGVNLAMYMRKNVLEINII